MNVFAFDLLPGPERLDHPKVDGELPYPLRHQIRRFAQDVRPDLTRHVVTKVVA